MDWCTLDVIFRGGSNSIAKYCNTFEILQYLLQYFRNFAILIAILCAIPLYCAILFVILSYFAIFFEILQYVAILTMLL